MADADHEMIAAAETLILCSFPPLNYPSPHGSEIRPLIQAKKLDKIPSLCPIPPWGLRLRRSRCSCALKSEQEDEISSDPVTTGRPSPATPLDYGAIFMPSTSGSDEAPSSSTISMAIRRSVPFEECTVVRSPPVIGGTATSPKPVRRHGKKKTINELMAQERLLVDDNKMLRTRVEFKRKEMEDLLAENRRLLDVKSSSRAKESISKSQLSLPDLNEPATLDY